MATKKSVGIIVRRGQLRRFDALARKTAGLPVVVSWDRRTQNRRASDESAPVERRSGDRRKTPPFTWETADFVVVDVDQEPEATSPAPTSRLDDKATKKGDEHENPAVMATVNRRKNRK
jgi:hypothetical protein